MAGFREVIESAPGNKIVSTEYGYSDLVQGIAKVQAQFVAHPEINVLYGPGGDHPLAHAKVVKEMGKAGKVIIVGFDDLNETLDYIREGVVLATIAQGAYLWGYWGIHNLYKLSIGEQIDEITYPPFSVVTRENIDIHKEDAHKSPGHGL